MWFILKIMFFMVLAVVVRGTLPRYRVDQLVAQNWKKMVFFYIFFVLELIIITYFLM
jgi:NADH:ubiquinone oxidoreductase subunit H